MEIEKKNPFTYMFALDNVKHGTNYIDCIGKLSNDFYH